MLSQLKRQTSLSIRSIILLTFTLSLLITIGLTGYFVFSNWRSSIESTVEALAEETSVDVLRQIEGYLEVPKHILEYNLGLLTHDLVRMDHPESREKFFVNVLNGHEGQAVYSFSYGDENGAYYGARRNSVGQIELMKNDTDTGGHSWYYRVKPDWTAGELVTQAGAFDARTRAWYQAAKEAGALAYSPIYKHFVMNDLTLSAAVPVYGPNAELLGVLGAHVTLNQVNGVLEAVSASKGAVSVIVEAGTGELVANSTGEDNYRLAADGSFQRRSLEDFGDPAFLEAYQAYVNQGAMTHLTETISGKHFVKTAAFGERGLDWLVLTSVEEGGLAAGYQRSFETTYLMTLMLLLLVIILFLKLSERLFEPMGALLEVHERFSGGDLVVRAQVRRQDEVGRLSESFNHMAAIIATHVGDLEEQVKLRTEALQERSELLQDHQDRLRLILDSTVEGICGLDAEGRCTFINQSALRILGYEDAEALVGQPLHGIIHHSRVDGTPIPDHECKIYQASLMGVGAHVSDEVFWRRDGTCFEVAYHSYPQLLNGQVVGTVVTFVDNTERRRMQQLLYNEKEQFKTTLMSVGDGVIATDHLGRIQVMNPVAEQLTGWLASEAIGKPFEEVFHMIHEFTRERCENPVDRVLELGEITELANHTVLIARDGREIAIEESAAPIRSDSGFITGVVMVFRDFTDKQARIREIEYLSYHDHLTGLYNRRYMEDSMGRLDTDRNLPFTVMSVDVNGLKLTNDAFGHKMGDRLLKAVAGLLRRVCRQEDLIGRVGGDEFLILLPRTSEAQAAGIKDRIREAAAQMKLESVIVSVAVGFATKSDPDQGMAEVLTLADNNMYKEKLRYGKLMRSQTIEVVLKNIHLKYDQEQIHTERVSEYCEAIARAMGLGEKAVQDVKTAGVLHDIGKIMIPPALLNKPGRLTEEEFEVVKRHPEISYQILKSVDEYAGVAEDVLHHHERLDGTGYPEGLSGGEIPLNARIIAVADAYEAMTAKRPYHRPKSREEAVAELRRCAGSQFDPAVVAVFVEKVV